MKISILILGLCFALQMKPICCFSDNADNYDHFNLLLREIQSGEKTGNFVFLDFKIQGSVDFPHWTLQEVWLITHNQKSSIVQTSLFTDVGQANGRKAISGLKWELHKTIQFKYRAPIYAVVNFVAENKFPEKTSGKRWAAVAKGFTKKFDYGQKIPYMLQSENEIHLKDIDLSVAPQCCD